MNPAVDVIEIRGLAKSYRTGHIRQKLRPVLRGLDLSVPRGEVFGYLGPNGSGKTTTLKVLTGLLRADEGQISVFGLPLADRTWRHRVGYLPENPYLYDYLTGREYLEYVGRLFGLDRDERRKRATRLLERVGLSRSSDVSLRRFSKGMLQRVGLAQALVNDPELVILDEPMSGLDPIGRHLARTLILELKDAGKTVFFSTHILSDAETLCDRVALLREGKVAQSGRLTDILTVDVSHLEILVSGVSAEQVGALPDVRSRNVGERLRLEVPEASLETAIGQVHRAGGRVLSVQPIRQSLEEFFVRETASAGAGGAWGD
ncbi:MAG: ABC transporter ATP-binding protein [Vicinamibacteria bacterium]